MFVELGCGSCHRTDARATTPTIGPSLAGLFGRQEVLSDGSTVHVDEVYLRESITSPDARTVAGYGSGVMAAGLGAARERLADPEVVDALIEYIRSLP